MTRANPLPREIAPGVFWLGDCLEQEYQGRAYHSYNAAFLLLFDEVYLPEILPTRSAAVLNRA